MLVLLCNTEKSKPVPFVSSIFLIIISSFPFFLVLCEELQLHRIGCALFTSEYCNGANMAVNFQNYFCVIIRCITDPLHYCQRSCRGTYGKNHEYNVVNYWIHNCLHVFTHTHVHVPYSFLLYIEHTGSSMYWCKTSGPYCMSSEPVFLTCHPFSCLVPIWYVHTCTCT